MPNSKAVGSLGMAKHADLNTQAGIFHLGLWILLTLDYGQ